MNSKKYILILLLTINFSCNMSQKNNDGVIYASIETNKGIIKTELFYNQTPVTVANFISLAEGKNKEVSDQYKGKKYYDGLTFHRVIPDFMIQGGDPTGTGSGSPGYNFKDEFVTAGGVDLKEIDFKSFRSKKYKSLYLAGEVLNIDAVTGGFNFQNAWTGGYMVAKAIAGDIS